MSLPTTPSAVAPSTPADQPTRSAALDVVRIIGIVAIVLGHAFTGDGVRAATFTWHVPLFFFLSGYLWRSGRSLTAETARRWQTLGRPYLAWLGIIGAAVLPVTLLADGPAATARRAGTMLIGGSYLKSPFHAFWFISCLFVGCLMYRAAERWWRWDSLWLVVPLCLIGAVAGPALAKLPLAAGTALPCLAFLILGHSMHRLPRHLQSWPVGVVAIALPIVLSVVGVNQPLDLKNGSFGVPLLGIACATLISGGLIVCAESAMPQLDNKANGRVTTIASLGLVVILTHGVPLYWFDGRAPSAVAAIVALAFGFSCGLVSARSRWAPILLGR